MRYFLAVFLLSFGIISAHGQQLPPIGTIDFYGLRNISEKDVLSVLKIKLGDEAFEVMKASEENRKLLKTLPNVEDASISLVCCDDLNGKSIVYVGIREKGTAVLTFRSAPRGNVNLPENILEAGKNFETAFAKSVEAKDFSQDEADGNAFFGTKDLRRIQQSFINLARQNLKILRKVLRESADAKQRKLAAQIIAYHSDKQSVVGDLVFAVNDSDEYVRNNAIRALAVIVNYQNSNSKLKIKVPPENFIRMLNSVEWTDRNKSLSVIDALSKKREANLISSLKSAALDSLVEMARWKNPGHAQSAFSILGRIGDFSEDEIVAFWKSENREQEIRKILEKIKKS